MRLQFGTMTTVIYPVTPNGVEHLQGYTAEVFDEV